MAADFGAGVVGDEQRIRAGRIGRRGAELVPPDPHLAPAAQLPGDQAHRLRVLAGFGAELEIDRPDFRIGQGIKHCARHFHRDAGIAGGVT